jgi:hypothetical protein
MSKHELQEIQLLLREKCPFKIIDSETTIKGDRYKISVGWTGGNGSDVQLRYLQALSDDIDENWKRIDMFSKIPKRQLDILTAQIKTEADTAIAKIEDFIHTECDAEIQAMITESICKQTPTEQDLRLLFRYALAERINKVNMILASMPRPQEFKSYRIHRRFRLDVGDKRLNEYIDIYVEDHQLTCSLENFEQALALFFTWTPIAQFVTAIASKLSKIAADDGVGLIGES